MSELSEQLMDKLITGIADQMDIKQRRENPRSFHDWQIPIVLDASEAQQLHDYMLDKWNKARGWPGPE